MFEPLYDNNTRQFATHPSCPKSGLHQSLGIARCRRRAVVFHILLLATGAHPVLRSCTHLHNFVMSNLEGHLHAPPYFWISPTASGSLPSASCLAKRLWFQRGSPLCSWPAISRVSTLFGFCCSYGTKLEPHHLPLILFFFLSHGWQ